MYVIHRKGVEFTLEFLSSSTYSVINYSIYIQYTYKCAYSPLSMGPNHFPVYLLPCTTHMYFKGTSKKVRRANLRSKDKIARNI